MTVVLPLEQSWMGTSDPVRVEYGYNPGGQLTSIDRFDSLDNLVATTTNSFDNQGRLAARSHQNDLSQVLAQYDYEYDLADQLVTFSINGADTALLYDAGGQVIAASGPNGTESFDYDLNGNRVNNTVVGTANRVLEDSEFEYEYDLEGNLVVKREMATGIETRYTYDSENRVTKVEEISSGGILLSEVSLVYDVFGRLIAETIDNDGAGSGEAVTRYSAYNGVHTWADFDETGAAQARYLFGATIDEIVARFRPGEGVAWYLTDHLGTVRDLVDNTGQIINHIEYSTFGEIVVESSPESGDRFKFTGREFNPILGLYYYRARHFDPQLGRFISEDPLGFRAGDANMYRYVFNSPLDTRDPTGLTTLTTRAILKQAARNALIVGAIAFPTCFVTAIVFHTLKKGRGGQGPDLRVIAIGCAKVAAVAAVTTFFGTVAALLQRQNVQNANLKGQFDGGPDPAQPGQVEPGQGQPQPEPEKLPDDFRDPGGQLPEGQNPVDELKKELDINEKFLEAQEQTTTFAYDGLSRLTAETNSLGDSRTFAYDAVGNLISQTDRNGRLRTFEFDGMNRMVQEVWWDSGAPVNTIEIAYDAAGSLTSAADAFSQYTFVYDDINRLMSVDNAGTPGSPHVILTYVGDSEGRVTSVTDNLGAAMRSSFDVQGNLSQRTWEVEGEEARVDFSYNARRERTELTRFGDLAGTAQVGRTNYTYDAKGRLTDLEHLDAIDQVLVDYDYAWDVVDRLVQESHHGNTSDYDYDLADQLVTADHNGQQDEDYQYDDNGNRIGSGYTVGSDNRITSDGTFNYSYDAEGNLISKTEIATGEVTTFTYDHRNRLVRAERHSAGGILLSESSYVYDVFNDRIAKIVDADGAGAGQAEETRFVYESGYVWAEFDGAGNLQARHFYSGKLYDEILARYRPGEGIAWYLADQLGSIRDIVDSTGAIIDHIDYDSFGNVLFELNPSAGDRYKFAGREFDAELGLYYNRARYYDPALGRFTSQDPIGFDAGDENLYRYVFNSPLNATDPTGRAVLTEDLTLIDRVAIWALKQAACITTGIAINIVVKKYIFPPQQEEPLVTTNDIIIESYLCAAFSFVGLAGASFGATGITLSSIAKGAARHAATGFDDIGRVFSRGLARVVARGADDIPPGALNGAGSGPKLPPGLADDVLPNPKPLLANRSAALQTQAALAGGVTREGLLDALTGLTRQGDDVATNIRNGNLDLNVLSDTLFERAWMQKNAALGRPNPGAAPQAFAFGEQLFVRKDAANILSEVVHEGTHGLDYIRGVNQSVRSAERRAYFFERQFQLAGGGSVDFPSLVDMLAHIIQQTP